MKLSTTNLVLPHDAAIDLQLHTPEQTAMFLEYAQRHNLLISSGSDSHSPEKPPIKYPAELSRTLLERLGIQIL